MKLFIIALVTLAVLSSPILTSACPPPPAPGYDGGEPGGGPLPGVDHHGDNIETGGNDSGPGADAPGDIGTGIQCM